MDKKVTAMTIIITPQITPCRRQHGVTLPWQIPEMALLQKSLCNGLVLSSEKVRLHRHHRMLTFFIYHSITLISLTIMYMKNEFNFTIILHKCSISRIQTTLKPKPDVA